MQQKRNPIYFVHCFFPCQLNGGGGGNKNKGGGGNEKNVLHSAFLPNVSERERKKKLYLFIYLFIFFFIFSVLILKYKELMSWQLQYFVSYNDNPSQLYHNVQVPHTPMTSLTFNHKFDFQQAILQKYNVHTPACSHFHLCFS